jgi:hypothetical protein
LILFSLYKISRFWNWSYWKNACLFIELFWYPSTK